MKFVGEFITKCGTLRVTDPCYDKDTWCAGTVENCVPGVWEAFVEVVDTGSWGDRVSKLVVKSKDGEALGEYESLDIDVGVDSGQAGVFDNELYKTDLRVPVKLTGNIEYDIKQYEFLFKRNQDVVKDMERNELTETFYKTIDRDIARLEELKSEEVASSQDFYDVCCDKTLGDTRAGTLEYGAVSSSGFGDGSYDAYALRDDKGRVCEIMIDFGVEEDEEDEENEDND